MRHDFITGRGELFAVVTRRSGDVEFMTYGEDPDVPEPLWRLDAEEAEIVAEVLGAPRNARIVPGTVSPDGRLRLRRRQAAGVASTRGGSSCATTGYARAASTSPAAIGAPHRRPGRRSRRRPRTVAAWRSPEATG